VGIAMGSGTDVARESADVVLIGNDLYKVTQTIRIARQCRSVIMQNFYGTLTVDTIGVGLAAIGLLNPLLAAFIHVSSEMTFILNSARLLPTRFSPSALILGFYAEILCIYCCNYLFVLFIFPICWLPKPVHTICCIQVVNFLALWISVMQKFAQLPEGNSQGNPGNGSAPEAQDTCP
jgi:hypothetical protein